VDKHRTGMNTLECARSWEQNFPDEHIDRLTQRLDDPARGSWLVRVLRDLHSRDARRGLTSGVVVAVCGNTRVSMCTCVKSFTENGNVTCVNTSKTHAHIHKLEMIFG
jgi:hypothetical protein